MFSEYLHLATYAGLIVGGVLLVVFGLALFLRDNSIIDIVYGPVLVLVSWSLAWLWMEWSWRQVILLVIVTLWGLRLGVRIFRKNWRKPEDFRYRNWRDQWQQKSMLYFFFRSLAQIYLLQGGVILVVLTPILITFSQTQMPLSWFNWAGLGVWGIGFFFETVGDWQLDRFVRNPENRGNIMTTGLWRYTRHPNYFGEATMWWGIWLLAAGLPLASLAILSPVLITFLLFRVSGVPMLEAKWAGRADWEIYKKKTSTFFPWFPKKV